MYDNKSVLEQMHYALMVQVMRVNGLAVLMDRPASGQSFRKMLYNIVIATDMGVHPRFMERFRQMVDGEVQDETEQRILVCQAIIKCADISNPVSIWFLRLLNVHSRALSEPAVYRVARVGYCA